MQYYNSIDVATFDEAILSNTTTIVTFRKAYGQEKTVAALSLIIADLADFYSVGGNMDANKVVQTAELIAETYWMLNLADVKLCIKKGKLGHYGQVFRMDGAVILDWFRRYFDDRINRADDMSYAEHLSRKEAGV